MILVSHEILFIKKVSDKILFLDKGVNYEEGSVDLIFCVALLLVIAKAFFVHSNESSFLTMIVFILSHKLSQYLGVNRSIIENNGVVIPSATNYLIKK